MHKIERISKHLYYVQGLDANVFVLYSHNNRVTQASPGSEVKYELIEAGAHVVIQPVGGLQLAAGCRVMEMDHGDTPSGIWVSDVETEPTLRRRGYAEAMLRVVLRIAAERGSTSVNLAVGIDNKPATALYKKLGFFFNAKGHPGFRQMICPVPPSY